VGSAGADLGVERGALEGGAVEDVRDADAEQALQVACGVHVAQPDLVEGTRAQTRCHRAPRGQRTLRRHAALHLEAPRDAAPGASVPQQRAACGRPGAAATHPGVDLVHVRHPRLGAPGHEQTRRRVLLVARVPAVVLRVRARVTVRRR